MIATEVPSQLLGPLGALVISLAVLGLFYTGKVLPRNAVPREDYDRLLDINASYAEALKTITKATDELVTTVRVIQRNGGVSP